MKLLKSTLAKAAKLELVEFKRMKDSNGVYSNYFVLTVEDSVYGRELRIRHYNDDTYVLAMTEDNSEVFAFHFESLDNLEAAVAAHIKFVAGNISDDCFFKKLCLLADCICAGKEIDPDDFDEIDWAHGKTPPKYIDDAVDNSHLISQNRI